VSFADAARAARDAALAVHGRPILIDPDGAAVAATAHWLDGSTDSAWNGFERREPGILLRIAAEVSDAHLAADTVVALLVAAGGVEIERRVLLGEPAAFQRRLMVEWETAPA